MTADEYFKDLTQKLDLEIINQGYSHFSYNEDNGRKMGNYYQSGLNATLEFHVNKGTHKASLEKIIKKYFEIISVKEIKGWNNRWFEVEVNLQSRKVKIGLLLTNI